MKVVIGRYEAIVLNILQCTCFKYERERGRASRACAVCDPTLDSRFSRFHHIILAIPFQRAFNPWRNARAAFVSLVSIGQKDWKDNFNYVFVKRSVSAIDPPPANANETDGVEGTWTPSIRLAQLHHSCASVVLWPTAPTSHSGFGR